MLVRSSLRSFIAVAMVLLADVGWSRTIRGSNFVLTKQAAAKNALERLIRTRRAVKQATTIERYLVTSTITSRYSVVHISSDVRNNEDNSKEVTFSIKLPKNAFISNFSMVIDDQTYVGIVKEKKVATQQYLAAVSQGYNAGLVEAGSPDLNDFDVSVNVAAGTVVTFHLHYHELLIRKLSIYEQKIYLHTKQVVEDMRLEVLIKEPIGITLLKAESSKANKPQSISIRRSKTEAFIVFKPTKEQKSRASRSDLSFTIFYDVSREKLGGDLLIRNGYFIHYFAPAKLPVLPKNVVFVIDKSGSMSGEKIQQTKGALNTILDDLDERDRFNLITFNANVQVWKPNQMMGVNQDTIAEAKAFVAKIYANGGTNLYGGTIEGVRLLNTITKSSSNSLEEASMLIVLTDGEPTSGLFTASSAIRREVKAAIHQRYSLFTLGFGQYVNKDLLEKLALENQGLYRQIYTDSSAPLQLQGFYKEVASPLLLNVILKYQGAETDKKTSQQFSNHFGGSEILVVGRIASHFNGDKSGQLQAVVEGQSVNGKIILTAEGKELEESFVDDQFDMEKLWAYLTIKDLLNNKTIFAENKTRENAIDKEILRLSLKFNFVTPLTSMVVTKPEDGKSENFTTAKPLPSSTDLYSFLNIIQARGGSSYSNLISSSSNALPPSGPSSRFISSSSNAFQLGGPSYSNLLSSSSSSQFGAYSNFNRPMWSTWATWSPSWSVFPDPWSFGFGGTVASTGFSRIRRISTTPSATTSSKTTTTRSPSSPLPTTTATTQASTSFSRIRRISTTPSATTSSKTTTTRSPSSPLSTTTATTQETQPSLPVFKDPSDFNPNCGDSVTIDSSINITTPSYPGLYPDDSLCVWNISLPENQANEGRSKLRLQFRSFDLESEPCIYDRVLVYRDYKPSATVNVTTLCGFSSDEKIIDAAEGMVVVFESDQRVSGRGFLASVSVVSTD